MSSSACSTRKEGEDGPLGAQGVPLTPGRSLAVDPPITRSALPVFVAAPELPTRRARRSDG